MEMLVKEKHKLDKQEEKQQNCKGSAILIKTWNVADLDGFGLGGFYLDGVSAYNFLFPPSCVPLFQIDRAALILTNILSWR